MIDKRATLQFEASVEGFNRLTFEKRELKSAIRKSGALVRSEARRLIAKRAISKAGEFPGYDSGAMSRAIKVKSGSGGGYVKVMPYKTAEMGDHFYPAYLNYGTSHGLKPRKNFMTAALENKQFVIRHAISAALRKGIKASKR